MTLTGPVVAVALLSLSLAATPALSTEKNAPEKGHVAVSGSADDQSVTTNGYRFNGYRFNGFRWNGFRWNGLFVSDEIMPLLSQLANQPLTR